jgi:hypothetical protein
MAQMRLGQVDMSTGEILEGATLAVFYPKRKNGFQSGGWFAMAQEPLMTLAQADLGKEAMRVLFAVLAKLDYENFISINQAELGRQLNIAPSNMSRAIARLVKEGVLLAGPKLQSKGTYSLNPKYGWKGSAKGHQEALLDRMKARGLSVVGVDHEPVDTRTLDLFDDGQEGKS